MPPDNPTIEHQALRANAPLSTWFGVGGRADLLARPRDEDELAALLQEPRSGPVRILGDGANLLVDDDGVDGLVISLRNLKRVEWRDAGRVFAQAGANLPRLVLDSVRMGLAGLEGLGGVPASVGGAVRMNAGGVFGEIGACVERVSAMTLDGQVVELDHDRVGFGYRATSLDNLIVLSAELRLLPADADALRARLKDVMARKKETQPLGERSAGCAFKNPTVNGERRSAGRLIDEAGCKGLRVGAAAVSDRHANFITVAKGATAADVLALIDEVAKRVLDRSGVAIEREVVVWRRGESP